MELEVLELKLKKRYDSSSLISLTAYIIYFIARKVDGYFWINYIALALLILNIFFIVYNLNQIYQNKKRLPKVSNYYLKNGLSFIITVILTVSIITLFLD